MASAHSDHPRVCGEQAWPYPHPPPIRGSPPRVRGTGWKNCGMKDCLRITPACAGNRSNFPGQHLMMWDHPRVCGEQQNPGRLGAFLRGSPPRVRGTASAIGLGTIGERITPACAGNSPFGCRQCAGQKDHPRVCGEQSGAQPATQPT